MCHYILKLIRISDNPKIERGMNFSHSVLAIFCENLLSTRTMHLLSNLFHVFTF